MSVYLITGASSDVGTALIDRLYREGDVFIAQGAGDLSHLAPLCRKYPGRHQDLRCGPDGPGRAGAVRPGCGGRVTPRPRTSVSLPRAARRKYQVQEF